MSHIPLPNTSYKKPISLFWRIVLGHGLSRDFYVCQKCAEVLDTRCQYNYHWQRRHQ